MTRFEFCVAVKYLMVDGLRPGELSLASVAYDSAKRNGKEQSPEHCAKLLVAEREKAGKRRAR